MSKALSNKVALIAGSSRGIGRAAALALAKEGAGLIGVHYASNADAAHSAVRRVVRLLRSRRAARPLPPCLVLFHDTPPARISSACEVSRSTVARGTGDILLVPGLLVFG